MSASASNGACQRWTQRRHSWRLAGEGGFAPADFQVTPISESAARAFVVEHHYSASYPATRLAYGLLSRRDPAQPRSVWIAGRVLVGVAVLSVPMRAAVLTNVFATLDPYSQSLELGRFVLVDEVPANGESWFLSRVWRLAYEAGVRGVVSFADPLPRVRVDSEGEREVITPGHVGIIYQASNAVACGRSTARTLNYVPSAGVVLPERGLSKIRTADRGSRSAERMLVRIGARPRRPGEDPASWLREQLAQVGVVKVRHPGNFRYAWPLGARRQWAPISLEVTRFPKPDRDLIAVDDCEVPRWVS